MRNVVLNFQMIFGTQNFFIDTQKNQQFQLSINSSKNVKIF